MKSLQAQFSVLPTADSVLHLHLRKHDAQSFLFLFSIMLTPISLDLQQPISIHAWITDRILLLNQLNYCNLVTLFQLYHILHVGNTMYSYGNTEINCCHCCISCFNQYMAFIKVNHGVNSMEKQAKYKQEEQKHSFQPQWQSKSPWSSFESDV